MPTRRVVILSILYLFLLAILQSVLSLLIFRPAYVPDLLLMLPLIAGIWHGRRYGFWMGLTAGFFRDFLAGRLLGPGILIGMYIGLAASLLHHEDRRFRLLFTAVSAPILTVMFSLLMTLLQIVTPYPDQPPIEPRLIVLRSVNQLPWQLLINVGAAFFVLSLFYLIPLRKREKRTNLTLGSSGGVEHDVFDLN